MCALTKYRHTARLKDYVMGQLSPMPTGDYYLVADVDALLAERDALAAQVEMLEAELGDARESETRLFAEANEALSQVELIELGLSSPRARKLSRAPNEQAREALDEVIVAAKRVVDADHPVIIRDPEAARELEAALDDLRDAVAALSPASEEGE